MAQAFSNKLTISPAESMFGSTRRTGGFLSPIQAPGAGFLAPMGNAGTTPGFLSPAYRAPVQQGPQQQSQSVVSPEKQAPARIPTAQGYTYNGHPITLGNQQSVLDQMEKIDGKNASVSRPTAPVEAPKPTQGLVAAPHANNASAPSIPTFPGLVTSISETSKPNEVQTGLIRDLQRTARDNQSIGYDARQLSEQYGNRIAETGRIGSGAVAGALSTGTSSVGSGNAAIASQSTSARMAALADAQQAALAGTGQQLTANQQQASAQQAALGGANTQQSQQISGLGTAAGLASPNLGAYGQGYYNPLTGQNTDTNGGGSLNPVNNIQSIAKQVVSGQISPSQAASLGGNVPNFEGALNQEILKMNPGYNAASSEGQFQARQANTVTSGTAGTNAYAGVYGQFLPQYYAVKQDVDNVDSLGQLLLNTASAGGINPFDLKYANNSLSWLRNNISSEKQIAFNAALSDFAGAASKLLASGSGQIPTDVSGNIQKIADGSISLGALNAMVQQAKLAGNAKLQNSATPVNQAGSMVGAPKVNAPGGASHTGTSSNPLGI